MRDSTASLWALQNRHDGDRLRLFTAVRDHTDATTALYRPPDLALRRLRLAGYRVDDADLERHLVPKQQQDVTVERLHELGRGIAYQTSPFAYLFERVR